MARYVRPFPARSQPTRSIVQHFSSGFADDGGAWPGAEDATAGVDWQASLQDAVGHVVGLHVQLAAGFAEVARHAARGLASGIGRPQRGIGGSSASRGETTSFGSANMSYEVESRRRADAHLHLNYPRGQRFVPRVHALHACDGQGPPIEHVRFNAQPRAGTPSLRIRIPDDHPPGLYAGTIVDAQTGAPGGILTVRVH